MSTTEPTRATALPTSLLRDIAAGLAAAEPLWRDALVAYPDARGHVRLVATDAYEAWLISWPSGHGVELHDHGGSTGVVAVAEGELVEVVALGGRRFLRTELAVGPTHDIDAECVHDVLNVSDAPAVSIHVYSPPLTSMTFYDDAGEVPVRTEVIYPEEPVPVEGDVARALHPATRLATDRREQPARRPT